MPIQELNFNPGFNPDFWKPPPIIEPPPEILDHSRNKFCTECQHFFTDSRPRWEENKQKLRETIWKRDDDIASTDEDRARISNEKLAALQYFSHHDARNVWLNAVNGTCDLCILIYDKICENASVQPLLSTLQQHSNDGSPVTNHSIRMAVCSYYGRFSTILVLITDLFNHILVIEQLEILTNVQAETLPVGMLRYEATTASYTSLAICSSWLVTCLRDHKKCKMNMLDPNISPSRLLDISGFKSSGLVTLCETASMAEFSYMTLSHCWGQSDRLRLTQANFQDFKMGMPIPRLALTFRQAMEITYLLRLRYLWIDCLCIIQDSTNDEDWLLEASKMASIYGNAICNIEAGVSTDSEGGCFSERAISEVQFVRFEQYPFPIYEGHSVSGPTFIAKSTTSSALKSYKGPLDERGWILQEQALAPRTLHFSKNQIFWECREFIASESWITGLPSDAGTYPMHVRNKLLFDLSSCLPHQDPYFIPESHELFNHRWKTIVELYTHRNLTRARDKLPALSGIADVFKNMIQDDYLAGLWRRTILLDLAWWIEPESRRQAYPSEYRAPSWSWASIDGVVLWDQVIEHKYDMESHVHHAKVVPLLATAETGQVTDGYLEITGSLRQSAWRYRSDLVREIQLTDEESKGWLNDEIKLYPDVSASNLSGTIFLLRLFRFFSTAKLGSRFGRHRLHGLILTPVDHDRRTYRRVGHFMAADWGFTKIADEGWTQFEDGWTTTRLTII